MVHIQNRILFICKENKNNKILGKQVDLKNIILIVAFQNLKINSHCCRHHTLWTKDWRYLPGTDLEAFSFKDELP